jgi:hypothetical protein
MAFVNCLFDFHSITVEMGSEHSTSLALAPARVARTAKSKRTCRDGGGDIVVAAQAAVALIFAAVIGMVRRSTFEQSLDGHSVDHIRIQSGFWMA